MSALSVDPPLEGVSITVGNMTCVRIPRLALQRLLQNCRFEQVWNKTVRPSPKVGLQGDWKSNDEVLTAGLNPASLRQLVLTYLCRFSVMARPLRPLPS